jgi:hypothetical protein
MVTLLRDHAAYEVFARRAVLPAALAALAKR